MKACVAPACASDEGRGWLAQAPKTRGTLKLEVDVDPQSFL